MLSHNRYILFFLSCVLYLQLFSQSPRSLIRFTENKNQWEDFIHYRAQLDGGALYVESNALTYSFYDKETLRSTHDNLKTKPVRAIKTTGFKVSFLNSNTKPLIESYNPYKDYNNYFIGKDKNRWAGNVKNYQKLMYNGLHYDRTAKISLHKGQLLIKTTLSELVEHEPYAYQIINGNKVEVPCGFKLKKNTVSFSFPKGYDKEHELVIDPMLVFACTSGSTADCFGFCATYDTQGNLYSGGIAFDPGYPLFNAYDSTYNGNSLNVYDVFAGGVVTENCPNVVITKYDSSGLFLHYSTYIGGSHSETVTSLIVDANNNLYMHGATGSSNFPITSQAYDNTFDGGDSVFFARSGTNFHYGSDLYVAKLSAGGNQLLASTFIGGSKNDGLNLNNTPYSTSNFNSATGGEYASDSLQYNYGDQYRGDIEIDNYGNPVIISCTRSSDFPIKYGFDNTLGGKQDAILFKFNPNLSQLQWSTFIGGSDNDGGYGMSIGKDNRLYITGGTRSSNFPVSHGAYDTTYNGGWCDGYIAKISQNGDSLLEATYIGTNNYDQSFFIQLDKTQNVYVYGQSLGNMTVTPSSIYNNPGAHQFISKLNNKLNSLMFQTVVGHSTSFTDISPTAFLIDNCQNVYISGWGGDYRTTDSMLNMPITPATIQDTGRDGYNFYLMQLSTNCNSLLYGTYYGGDISKEHVHGGTSRYDKRGIVYQTLCTSCLRPGDTLVHQDFPLYPANAWPGDGIPNHNTQDGNCTEGVFKINFSPPIVVANFTANNYGCAPLTVNFHNASSGATSYLWNFGGTDTTSSVLNPIRTYSTAGTYTAMLMVYNPTTCNLSDTSVITIVVYPNATSVAFTVVYDSCINKATYTTPLLPNNSSISYTWNFGNGQTSNLQNPGTYTYAPGTYTASLTLVSDEGCGSDSMQQVIHFTINPVNAFPDTAFCFGKSLQLNASGGISYTWQPSSTLSNANIANPIATPTVNTIYTVTIHQLDGGGRTCNYTLTDSIKLYPQTTAAFSDSINPCGNSVFFKDSSYLNIISWHWNFGDSTAIDTLKNPTHSYTKPGNYTVTLVVNNQYNCPDSTTKVFHLSGFSPINISKSVIVCSGKKIQLNATGGISYTWTPPYNLDSAYIHNPVATPTATTHYTLVLTQIVGGTTCASTLHTNITVPVYSSAALTVYASPDTIIDGNFSQLSTSLSSGYIVWAPDYNLSNDSILNPTASPHHTTTYNAVYIDPNGCVFRLNSVTIYVLDANCNENTVFVPNTFTPNGDGRNDVLYARSAFVTDIYFTIYDRWGEQVFTTNDINLGWNGIFNGKPCNPDVFGYYVTFTCNDGKKSFKKGNVTLIR